MQGVIETHAGVPAAQTGYAEIFRYGCECHELRVHAQLGFEWTVRRTHGTSRQMSGLEHLRQTLAVSPMRWWGSLLLRLTIMPQSEVSTVIVVLCVWLVGNRWVSVGA